MYSYRRYVMKKKIFALLLVVLMLVPFVVACGGTETDTNSETNTNTNTDTESETPGTTDTTTESDVVVKVDTKTDKSQKWSGKTLDVLASGWGQDAYGATSAWSQPELYVNSATDERHMGTDINSAVWARQLRIQKDYGVTMKWHQAGSNASMQNEMQTGLRAGYAKFHLATPRAYEAQSLIAADTVYDLANSKYIDLTKSYYNQSAVDSYSIYGHTFYVSGDFSYLDEYTSFVLFYNQAMVESEDYELYFGNLYNKVRNGKWTISELIKLCSVEGLSGNIDNTEGFQDTDSYTFAAGGLSAYFQASKIQQVSVDKSSGDKNTYNYRITLNDNPTAVASLVSELVKLRDSEWSRSNWDGGYGAMLQALTSGRVLFYQEVVQKILEFPEQTETFKMGVLPLPMLNEDQDGYATVFASQTTVLCVPKANNDREMGEYFLDVLSWSGQDYVMRAFTERLEAKLYDDGESSREDALEMLTDYIFPNIMYDQGFIYSYPGQNIMSTVQSDTISRATSSSSDFTQLYTEAFPDANDKLNNKDTGWNTYAKNYTDAIKVEG